MKRLMLWFSVLVFSALIPCTSTADFEKTKVAVLDFQLQGQGYETTDMGKIVAEWLITALVKEGRFEVIERRLLAKIIQEQKLVMTGIVDEQSATELGKLLGVKVIISGSVMKLQDFMEVNARIIDVESASIITAERVKSTSTGRLEELVVKMAEKIIKDFPLEGYVVNRDKNRAMIDLGKRTGVKRGMRFIAYKEGEVIKHPKTGEVLDVKTIQTGILEVDKVREKIAETKIIKENKPNAIAYGQMVKSMVEPSKPISRYTEPADSRKTKPKKPKKSMSDVELKLAKVDPILKEMKQLKTVGNVQWEVKYKEAFHVLKPIYAQYPYSPLVYYYYAKVNAAADKIRGANKNLEKAVYYDPEYKAAFMLKGDINYTFGKKISLTRFSFIGKNKRYKLGVIAKDAYESAADLEQDKNSKAMIYFKIGNVYAELSDAKEKAEKYWQKAATTSPNSKAARLAKKRLAE
jgi:TolB-like protein